MCPVQPGRTRKLRCGLGLRLWTSSHRIWSEAAASRSIFGGILKTSRAFVVLLLAWTGLLLAPVQAHAAMVCWMSDGVRYCYDDGTIPGTPPPSPEPPPAPEPDPVVTPPAPPAPPPATAPAPPPNPEPNPAPVYQAPRGPYVPPKAGTGYQAPALVPVPQGGPANHTDAAAEAVQAGEAPAEAAPAQSAAPVESTAAATPPERTSPSPAATPPAKTAAVTASSEDAHGAEGFSTGPWLFIAGGVMLTAALVWFVGPLRAAVVRVLPTSIGSRFTQRSSLRP